MKRTYYVVSTNENKMVNASETKEAKTLNLSRVAPQEPEEGVMPVFAMVELSLSLDDPAEFDAYTVGTEVTLTLAVAAD